MFRAGSKIRVQSIASRYTQSVRFASFKLAEIPTLEALAAEQSGFSGLFSKQVLQELWFKRGHDLTTQVNTHLNELDTSSFDESGFNLKEVISSTTNKPQFYDLHKAASYLYNLQFFFENIKPVQQVRPGNEVARVGSGAILETPRDTFANIPKDEEFVAWITDSFGSVDEFRTLLLNSGRGIKGDGTVWLAAVSGVSQDFTLGMDPSRVKYQNLAVVNTYNGGILNDGDRAGQMKRMKSLMEMRKAKEAKENKTTEEVAEISSIDEELKQLSLGNVEDAEYEVAFHNKSLLPLLAIDVSPSAYLLDYGVYGKDRYLENAWECIDWDVVISRMPARYKQALDLF